MACRLYQLQRENQENGTCGWCQVTDQPGRRVASLTSIARGQPTEVTLVNKIHHSSDGGDQEGTGEIKNVNQIVSPQWKEDDKHRLASTRDCGKNRGRTDAVGTVK